MPGDWHCADEIVQCELPAQHTWIEFDNFAVAISRDLRGTLADNGQAIDLICAFIDFSDEKRTSMLTFMLMTNGEVAVNHPPGTDSKKYIDICSMAINTAWYCIEAMQTPGGLCHQVPHNPSRQAWRNAERQSWPCHKWVQIRLGRGSKKSGGVTGNTLGRTVAWHYRRGHKVEHPNPNYPKWRKGGWVGDVAAGIRTHNYVLEVPHD